VRVCRVVIRVYGVGFLKLIAFRMVLLAVFRSALRLVVVCCSVLQHVAACCSVLLIYFRMMLLALCVWVCVCVYCVCLHTYL